MDPIGMVYVGRYTSPIDLGERLLPQNKIAQYINVH